MLAGDVRAIAVFVGLLFFLNGRLGLCFFFLFLLFYSALLGFGFFGVSPLFYEPLFEGLRFLEAFSAAGQQIDPSQSN